MPRKLGRIMRKETRSSVNSLNHRETNTGVKMRKLLSQSAHAARLRLRPALTHCDGQFPIENT